MRVDPQTGEGVVLCVLNVDEAPYNTITFSRDNQLFASHPTADRLDRIDPCSCEVTQVGPLDTSGDVLFVGITSAADNGLFGVGSLNDNVQTIAPDSGQTGAVGSLGVNFQSSGATWSEQEQLLYAINAGNDALYSVDTQTGTATLLVDLDRNFLSVGITEHPGTGVLYACDSDGMLYSVDPSDGATAQIGSITGSSCNNLAAPWGAIGCIENP